MHKHARGHEDRCDRRFHVWWRLQPARCSAVVLLKFPSSWTDEMGMNRSGRLVTILATGALAVVGTVTWFHRSDGDIARAQAAQACERRFDGKGQAALVPLTKAQRVEALTIAAADPLIQRLWGGSAPPFATGPSEPGLFIFPKMPIADEGPLGVVTTVNLWLPHALPEGTYRWKTMSAKFRHGCEADGLESVTIQDADGGAGAIGLGQPYSRTPVILVEVSLTMNRVASITPNGGDPGTWHNAGQPEHLVAS